jgi:prevent-host-death family protein
MNAKSSARVRVGVTKARSHFADLLKRAQRGQEHFVLEKGGIAVAVLIDMHEYDDFLRWRAQQELRGLGQAMAEQAKRAGLEEEDLAAALEVDRRAVHDMHYRQQAGE